MQSVCVWCGCRDGGSSNGRQDQVRSQCVSSFLVFSQCFSLPECCCRWPSFATHMGWAAQAGPVQPVSASPVRGSPRRTGGREASRPGHPEAPAPSLPAFLLPCLWAFSFLCVPVRCEVDASPPSIHLPAHFSHPSPPAAAWSSLRLFFVLFPRPTSTFATPARNSPQSALLFPISRDLHLLLSRPHTLFPYPQHCSWRRDDLREAPRQPAREVEAAAPTSTSFLATASTGRSSRPTSVATLETMLWCGRVTTR